MAIDFNPYAPPRASLENAEPAEYWREGKLLVMTIGSTLPPYCVKCNQPAVEPIQARTVVWHHPGWYILFFLSIPIYIIVALIVRKKAKIAPGLCAAHLKRRRLFLTIGWSGFILGLLMMFISIANDWGVWISLGILTMLISIIAGMIGARIVYPTKISLEQIRLKGCGEDFLDNLTER